VEQHYIANNFLLDQYLSQTRTKIRTVRSGSLALADNLKKNKRYPQVNLEKKNSSLQVFI
jgi:hypothetical protein